MQILSVRLNTAHHRVIELAPSPSGHDDHLWSIPAGPLRDACCVTRHVLSSDRLELTIRLRANPAPSTRISIAGRSLSGSTVLGADLHAFVEAGAWTSGEADCRIALDSTGLQALGVVSGAAQWDWHWTDDGRGGPLGTSEHLVFVIADTPVFPWTAAARPAPGEARPWPGVLALACEWARGETTTAAIPDRILDGIAALHQGPGDPWRYDAGARSYLNAAFGPPHFYCKHFIAAARDRDRSLPHRLSCYEGAAVMTTFANVLGCDLKPALTRRNDCRNFFLNATWPMGRDPQHGRSFHVHVVACARGGGSRAESPVYDPLIRFDTDALPAEAPNQFGFASGIPLGDVMSPVGAGFYLPQLVREDHRPSCGTHDLQVAQIEPPDDPRPFDPCDGERWDRYSRELRSRGTQGFGAPTMFRIDRFTRFAATTLPEPPPRARLLPAVPRRTRTVYEPDPAATDLSGVRLIADFWTSTTDDSLSFMAELMALADQPPIPANWPGIAYVSADGETLWVLFDGATARLASVGQAEVNLVHILSVATPL